MADFAVPVYNTALRLDLRLTHLKEIAENEDILKISST